jgi:hypothetical protein
VASRRRRQSKDWHVARVIARHPRTLDPGVSHETAIGRSTESDEDLGFAALTAQDGRELQAALEACVVRPRIESMPDAERPAQSRHLAAGLSVGPELLNSRRLRAETEAHAPQRNLKRFEQSRAGAAWRAREAIHALDALPAASLAAAST